MNTPLHLSVFGGEDGLKHYLTPGSLGPTPLVELPAKLNPFHTERVRIFIKLATALPLGNIKSLPAWNMLERFTLELGGEEVGTSKARSTELPSSLIEYSSGNTALSLTVLAPYFGIPETRAIIAPDVPEIKQRLLRLVGTQLLLTHGPASPQVFASEGGIYEASILADTHGWKHLNQYTNPGNPDASSRYVGNELIEQLGDKLSVLVTSIGTSGTITGLTTSLKTANPNIKIVGTSIKTGSSIPGPRGEIAIQSLAFPWQSLVDVEIPITTIPAYTRALELIRSGLFVGPSTGMQLEGVYNYIKRVIESGEHTTLRNTDGELVVTFLACDSMYPYIDDFFKVLPDDHFPKIIK